ncbi:MAG TPA: lytic transglycosylase domain-containing protein [Bryobacteraceae bacterium]|nr:lytic transglycosylase domain-containing protein [Bryobacteraceae bacterium]
MLAAVVYTVPARGASPQVATVVRADPRTGRLVRSYVASAKPEREKMAASRGIDSQAPVDSRSQTGAVSVEEAVERMAREMQLSPRLIHSVIQVESNYNPYAVSSKGALGLMQLVPATARRFGVSDVFDPADNIKGGARYLKYLLDLFHNDYPKALAAYNAGEGAVFRYGGVPPYPETRSYLSLVQKRLQVGKKAEETKKAEPAPVEQSGYNPIRSFVGEDGKEYYVSQ